MDVRGVRRRELKVIMDPQRMTALGVDVRDVASVLGQNNVNISGGTITDGPRKLIVRTVGEFRRPEDIRETPIGASGLRVGDVAEVRYQYPQQTSFDYLNGEEAVTFRIYKASTANVLQVADGVKAEMEEIAAVPRYQEIGVRYIGDSSVDVRGGLSQLTFAGIFGGGLAILILLLFLQKVRTTLLVAVAIPLSIITTFVILYLGRQAGLVDTTLNVISLFGLMVAVGMLADPAIVVIDSISRHFTEYKEDSRTAAIHGASAVTMPIIAGAATTMCVFVPLIFLGATMGGFFRIFTDFGFTLSVVIVASLLVALSVVPMAAGGGAAERETGVFAHHAHARPLLRPHDPLDAAPPRRFAGGGGRTPRSGLGALPGHRAVPVQFHRGTRGDRPCGCAAVLHAGRDPRGHGIGGGPD